MAQEPTILKTKKTFFLITLGLCIILCLPFIFIPGVNYLERLNILAIYTPVAIIGYCIVSYVIYYIYHRKVKTFKEGNPYSSSYVEEQRIVVSTDFGRQNTVVSNGVFAIVNMLIIVATIVIPILYYDNIPYQVPTHWGADGIVTTYTEKSLGLFLIMPIIQLVLLGVFLVANHGIKRAKQKVNVKKPKVSTAQSIAFRYAMSKFLFAMSLASTVLLLVIQCTMAFDIRDGNLILYSIGIIMVPAVIGTLYIAIRYGQGGERYKVPELGLESKAGSNYDDDKHWIAGLIYYNPEDQAVWVEKRFGLGMTINIGSRGGLLIIIGIFLALALMVALPFVLGF
jgi:uncharacterized membrane protein